MIIVSDTTCISHLALVGLQELLPKLFGQVIIPPAVGLELAQGAVKHPEIEKALHAPWLEIRTLHNSTQADELALTIDRGEAEAIALALELKCPLLMDDLPGRRCAEALQLKFTGTLGVLVDAKKRGCVEAVKPVLTRMLSQDRFRISPALLERILKEVGE